MKQIFTWLILLTAVVALTSDTIRAIKPFPPKANSGAPGESTCIDCHTGTPLNGGPGNITITFSGKNNKYKLNKIYTMTVTTTDPSEIHFSFETTSLDAANNPAGTPKLIDSSVTLIQTDKRTGRKYVTDYDATPLNTWTFKWKAPATNVGNVSFYLDGVAANGDLTNHGDHVYTSVPLVLSPASSARDEATFTEQDEFNVFPAPAHDGITLQFSLNKADHVLITLYDLNGKKLEEVFNGNEEEGTHQYSIQFLNPYAAGIYMLKMQCGVSSQTKKIIIQ